MTAAADIRLLYALETAHLFFGIIGHYDMPEPVRTLAREGQRRIAATLKSIGEAITEVDGKAALDPATWTCLADVDGALCRVEVRITPTAGPRSDAGPGEPTQ